jgi:hypothetical protein
VKKGTGERHEYAFANCEIFFWQKVCYPTLAFVTLYTNHILPTLASLLGKATQYSYSDNSDSDGCAHNGVVRMENIRENTGAMKSC